MSELERLVVLLALQLQGSGVTLDDETRALLEVVHSRAESTRGYDKTRRGIDALERVQAREEEREVDYPVARARATQTQDL